MWSYVDPVMQSRLPSPSITETVEIGVGISKVCGVLKEFANSYSPDKFWNKLNRPHGKPRGTACNINFDLSVYSHRLEIIMVAAGRFRRASVPKYVTGMSARWRPSCSAAHHCSAAEIEVLLSRCRSPVVLR
jgi:hypothetical protein